MSDFSLRKWYLDAADERGRVFIGYWATTSWKGLSLHFFQHLWIAQGGQLRSFGSFASSPEPQWQEEGVLRWPLPGLRGEWHASRVQGLSEQLLADQQGGIRWVCHQPKAWAKVDGREGSLEGWGYTECIEISIPPWKLPIKTLYWGRCHSASHYLVWIKWEGPSHQSLLWHNGQRLEDFSVSDAGVKAVPAAFEIDESLTLRKGTIGRSVFRALGPLAWLVPSKTRRIHEHKLYGTGRIVTQSDSQPATAIFEKVEW